VWPPVGLERPPAEEGGSADLRRPLSCCAMEMVASQTHAACVQADPGGPPLARMPPARRGKCGLGYRLLAIPGLAAAPRSEGRWNPGGRVPTQHPKGCTHQTYDHGQCLLGVADTGPRPWRAVGAGPCEGWLAVKGVTGSGAGLLTKDTTALRTVLCSDLMLADG
jgi:hypothetical protein